MVDQVSTGVITLLAHQVPLSLDSAGTAWVLTSTALVLLMTLPGLGLFYGGMVRRKNLLSVLTQTVAAFMVVSLLWFGLGYSLAFGQGPNPTWQAVLGGFDSLFLSGVTVNTAHKLAKGLPEFAFIAYQMTFAIITPALIAGAFAERMKFSSYLLFIALWHLLVYVPVCHWVWGEGVLGGLGVLDFAGGAVVHVNSGVAGLVCALVLGPRRGFGRDNMAPHNLSLTLVGAALLTVGWMGFNAGSALAADGLAAIALFNSLLAAAAGALGWLIPEWIERKKPTLLGLLSGLIAGLVGITPAAGFVDPRGAFLIGVITAPICYFASTWLKAKLKYDDSLDAFGIHGVGGLVGAVLTGVFATLAVNPAAKDPSAVKQLLGTLAVVGWTGVFSYISLRICQAVFGLRVSDEDEIEGLDATLHGESLQT